MKLRPILFSPPMVQAILEGSKTQTRRLTGLDFANYNPDNWDCIPFIHGIYKFRAKGFNEGPDVFCPYGQPGDVLWVREMHYRFGHWEADDSKTRKSGRQAWKFVADTDEIRYAENAPAGYRKGRHNLDPLTPAWHKRNSLFMPFSACRIFLKVKGLNAERLQVITEEDAKAEGVEPLLMSAAQLAREGQQYKDYMINIPIFNPGTTAKGSFKSLWHKINGEESWTANPWVWVIEFEKIAKPENFS